MANPDKNGKAYSGNEVSALLEEIKSEFRAVAEVVAPLPERLDRVEERLANVQNEVRALKDVVSIAMPDLNKRVTRLEAGVR